MLPWAQEIDALAEQRDFAGVVAVDRGGHTEFSKAYGLADRASQVPNTVRTRFGIASGTKGLTALAVVSLISDGALSRSTTARSVLGQDLPLIGADVPVEHLLAHRSGIGDYLDEQDGYQVTDYVLTVPAQELTSTEAYLAVLGGHPAKFRAGERFCYCNSGYVVLALIAERVGGVPFPQLVRDRVCRPAGLDDTGFLRSDELPGRTAIGYLPIEGSSRTNVFHLPVMGSGDGGIYSTAATSAPCGDRCSRTGSCRPDGSPSSCSLAATCPLSRCGTASASGSIGTPARCCWREWTPASHSGACITRSPP